MSQTFFKSGPWEREKKLSFINFSAELSRNLNINVTLWVGCGFFCFVFVNKKKPSCEALEGLYLFLLN